MYDSLIDSGGEPPALPVPPKSKFGLIDDWHRAWRYWSVRLNALATALLALLLWFPDVAREIWIGLPDELKAVLPYRFAYWVPVAIGAGAVVARVIKQQELPQSAAGSKPGETVAVPFN